MTSSPSRQRPPSKAELVSLPALAEYRVGQFVERVTVLIILASGDAVVAHANGQLEAVSLERCCLLGSDDDD